MIMDNHRNRSIKRIVVTNYLFCMILLTGCGAKNVSNVDKPEESNGIYSDAKDRNSVEELSLEKESKLIDSFLQVIKTNDPNEYILKFPSELAEDENYIRNINETCTVLPDILMEKYGEIIDIDYEVVDVINHEIDTLKNDLKNDIDSIEDLNKGIEYLLEADCKMQKCIELTINLSIKGTKESEQREIKYFFVYQIDNQWYTDGKALFEFESEIMEDE